MKLTAIIPARNEGYILGLSARVALMWCDSIVLLDHASTDDTRGIMLDLCDESPDRVALMSLAGPWHEMAHRQSMLDRARDEGATHIALVDADEILCAHCLPAVRRYIEALPRNGLLRSKLYNMRGTVRHYHANGLWGNREVSLAFRDDPRACWQGDQFHHREPFNVPWTHRHFGEVMHLWGCSERRLRAKHALYKLTERLRWPDKSVQSIDAQYGQAIIEPPCAGWSYTEAPTAAWEPYRHLLQYLEVDREPWQIEECRHIVKENPGIETGLDLFGVLNAAR